MSSTNNLFFTPNIIIRCSPIHISQASNRQDAMACGKLSALGYLQLQDFVQ
jgi:hypothetical protein